MAKTDFLTADMTRRQFMKISGKSLAGLTLSASMLSLFGCSQKQVDSGAVATWALPQGLLVVNADLCTGCQRCEINCTLTNDGVCSSYISRVKIQRRLNLDGAGNGLLSGNDNCFVYFPDTCRQCEDPACGNACPQKAITTNAQGIRVVDTDKCIGLSLIHIWITALFELAGAALLLPTFCADYGLRGIWYALFHSISAFCNAGFDLLGTEGAKFVSLTQYDLFIFNRRFFICFESSRNIFF